MNKSHSDSVIRKKECYVLMTSDQPAVVTMGIMEQIPFKVAPSCPQQDQYVEIPQVDHVGYRSIIN